MESWCRRASLDYDASSQRTLVTSVNAQGEMHSAGVTVTRQNAKIQIRNLGARYSLANGNAAVTGIHGQVLGGALGGIITMRDLGGATRSHLSASLKGASLAGLQKELKSAMASSSSVTNQIALRGSADATADATWGTTLQDLLARADATLQANIQPAQGGTATPVSGVIHIRYAGKSGQLSFDQSYIKTLQTSVTLNGTISDHAALQANVNSNDLHELETIAAAFEAPGSEPFGLYGRATLTAAVSGSTRTPQVAGQVTAGNLRLRGSEWKLLRANFTATPSQVRVDRGEMDSASRGRVTFKLATALLQWSLAKTSPFQLQLSASQINVQDLLKAAGSTAPVAGTLSADITASGTQLAPLGHGTLGLSSARVAGEPIRSVYMQFQATGKQVTANLKMDLRAGSANATVLYEPASQSYNAQLHAPGMKLDQLETLKARNLQLQGVLELNASGKGTQVDPQMQALIEVPQLQIRDQAIRGLKLQTNVANHVATFTLDSEALNTHAGGHGSIQLNGDYVADLSVDTKAIPLAPWFALYAPSQAGNLSGQTEIHATLRGP